MSEEDSEYEEEEEIVKTAFIMMNKSDIPKMIKTEIDETCKLLVISEDAALALLIHMKWNKEKLREKYFEDIDKLQESAGVKPTAASLKAPSESIIDVKKKNFVCNICIETRPLSEYFALACHHGYCKQCLSASLQYRLTAGSCCIETPCAKQNCNVIFPLSVVKTILDAKSFSRYNFFLEKSFLECQKNLKLCPAPNCNYLAKRTMMFPTTDVKCTCGFTYCFLCSRATHSPVPCVNMEKWEEKINSSGLSDIWILTNTKKCPKCKVNIEKNDGCNHMTCKNPRCGHQFCWICSGDWRTHGERTGGFYSCNRPVKKEATTSTSDRDSLEYFNHYYTRYSEHNSSLGFAVKQLAAVQSRQRQYMSSVLSKNRKDADFIREAMELVVECRRLLRCSYVLGYYLRDGRQKDSFEFQQQFVENYTEGLAELTEKPVDGRFNREKIITYTHALNKFVKNILDYYSSENLQLVDRK